MIVDSKGQIFEDRRKNKDRRGASANVADERRKEDRRKLVQKERKKKK